MNGGKAIGALVAVGALGFFAWKANTKVDQTAKPKALL